MHGEVLAEPKSRRALLAPKGQSGGSGEQRAYSFPAVGQDCP